MSIENRLNELEAEIKQQREELLECARYYEAMNEELEAENARLKKMYAEERLKAEIVQDALEKKW